MRTKSGTVPSNLSGMVAPAEAAPVVMLMPVAKICSAMTFLV
jgi:hypothetical protein